jgi:hypothetical protein
MIALPNAPIGHPMPILAQKSRDHLQLTRAAVGLSGKGVSIGLVIYLRSLEHRTKSKGIDYGGTVQFLQAETSRPAVQIHLGTRRTTCSETI